MILDSPLKTIRAYLGEAAVTTNPTFVSSYKDVDAISVFLPGANDGALNGVTPVAIVSNPPSGQQRDIIFINICNVDTVSHSLTVELLNNATQRKIIPVTLAPNERLEYSGDKFNVYGINGLIKTLQQAAPYVANNLNIVVLAADVINNNAVANTIQNVTGLSFPVIAGETYWFEFVIPYTSAATTTGSRWTINGPASPTMLNYTSEYTLAATTKTLNNATAYDIPAASNASSLTTGNVATVWGIIKPSSDGTVIARFASEVLSSAITAKAGAVCRWMKVL